MDLDKIKNIYMIGIKGVGMTMLAQFLASKGHEVSGSDTDEKFMTDEILQKAGIPFKEGFSKDNIPDNVDLIIYSSAYNPQTNPEVAIAMGKTTLSHHPQPLLGQEGSSFKRSGANEAPIKSPLLKAGLGGVMTYAEVLGEIFNQMHGIAVCGSHGKTTVTAWLGYVLMKSGLEPNVLVGSNVPQFGGAITTGESNYLIIEADEYQNKLKYYQPKGVLLNNIDHDHHDFFPTKESYVEAFSDFVKKIPKKGFLVANFDDEDVTRLSGRATSRIISYAIDNDASLMAYDIKNDPLTGSAGSLQAGSGQTRQFFKVKMDGEELGDFSISLLGKHNIYNALSVIATSIELDVDLKDIRTHLADFTGTERRMSVIGTFKGATIIDDYAHHPTEIKSTLEGLRTANPDKKIIVVFHPHTFTRTKALFDEFADSFREADKVIVLDIYGSAREKQGGVSSAELKDKIKEKNPNKEVLHLPSLEEAEEYLRNNIQRGEIILLMGAGDVFRIGQALVD